MSQAPIFPPGSGSDHPTGRGIGVAVLDTGCFPHEDYQARIAAFFDMVRRRRLPYDDNGHGTHVCGIIAGNGSASKGRFCGIAPGCHLIPVKVLDKRGGGYVSDVLAGLHLILQQRDRFNIRIVNVSVGSFSGRNMSETSALVRGVEEIWDAGFVVVVAAGNMGPKRGTITTPGIPGEPMVPSVAAITMVTIMGQVRSMLYSCATNTAVMPCMIAPDRARHAPTMQARRFRGKRTSRMMVV